MYCLRLVTCRIFFELQRSCLHVVHDAHSHEKDGSKYFKYDQITCRFAEEHGIIEDSQEAFRRNRSTIWQLQKIICLLDAQRRQKWRSLILFLDLIHAFNAMNHSAIFSILRLYGFPDAEIADIIKEFNAMNHSAIFSILRLYGFPDADIALMTRLYDHTFLFIGNRF